MNINIKLINGTISLQNNMLIIYAQSNKSILKKEKSCYNLNSSKIIISKHIQPSLFRVGEFRLECSSKNNNIIYRLTYNKTETSNVNKLIDTLTNYHSSNNNVLTFIGSNGVIDLYDNKLVIKRDDTNLFSLIAHGVKGDKDILLSSITAIQLKTTPVKTKSKPLSENGYIQFTIKGGNESRSGLSGAIVDENTVTFSNHAMEDFKHLKELIYSKQEALNNKTTITDTYTTNKQISSMDEKLNALEKLGQLRDKNYISDEEFELQKQQILNL